MNNTLEKCLNDLYLLGVIQGEHNINWTDEYHLLEYSKDYYRRIKSIADEQGIDLDSSLENYRDDLDDDDEYFLWDRMGFHLNELIQEEILNKIRNRNQMI